MPAGSQTQTIVTDRILFSSLAIILLSVFIAGSQSTLERDHQIIVDLLRKNSTTNTIDTRWDFSFDGCRCSVLRIRPDLSKDCVDDYHLTLNRIAILTSELLQMYLFPSLFLRNFTGRHGVSRALLAICALIISSTAVIVFTNPYLHHHIGDILVMSGAVLFAYVTLRLQYDSEPATCSNRTSYRIRQRSTASDAPLIPLVDKSWRALL